MKPIDKSDGWEKRIYREVAGPTEKDYLAKQKRVDGQMEKRLSLWTPDGERDITLGYQQQVSVFGREMPLFWDASLDGLSSWSAEYSYGYSGINRQSAPVLPKTQYVPFVALPNWSIGSWSLSPAQGFKVDGIKAPDETEDTLRYQREQTEREKRYQMAIDAFEKSVVFASSWTAEDVPRETIAPKTPDYTECLTGWRVWNVENGRLASTGVGGSWAPRIAVPCSCLSNSRVSHQVPAMECSCGYHTFKSEAELILQLPVLCDFDIDDLELLAEQITKICFGPVHVWGRVIECENGYRSEYAYPKEIRSFNPEHKRLSAVYGVPVRTPSCSLALRPVSALAKG